MRSEDFLEGLFWGSAVGCCGLIALCAWDLPLAKYTGVQIGVVGMYLLGYIKGVSS